MTKPAQYPDAMTEGLRDGRRVHIISCTCGRCAEELVICMKGGRRKPPSVLTNMARRRGWLARPKKATFLCPTHAN